MALSFAMFTPCLRIAGRCALKTGRNRTSLELGHRASSQYFAHNSQQPMIRSSLHVASAAGAIEVTKSVVTSDLVDGSHTAYSSLKVYCLGTLKMRLFLYRIRYCWHSMYLQSHFMLGALAILRDSSAFQLGRVHL